MSYCKIGAAFARYENDCNTSFIGVLVEDWMNAGNADTYFPFISYEEIYFPYSSEGEMGQEINEINHRQVDCRTFFIEVVSELAQIESDNGYQAACQYARDKFSKW